MDAVRVISGVVEQIKQLTDTRTHWVTSIGGVKREFDAEITEQHPDERVAWAAVDGPLQAGSVSFQQLDPTRTRVLLHMEFAPEGVVEKAGDKLGVVERRVKGDLERFKRFIEARGTATGGWRGNVEPPPSPNR